MSFRTPLLRGIALRSFVVGLSVSVLFSQVALGAEDKSTAVEQTQEYIEAKAEIQRISTEITTISIENFDTLDKIETVHNKMEDTQAEIDEAEDVLAESQAKLEQKKAALSQRVSSSYKSGGINLLSILFNVNSFEDLVAVIHYMDRIVEADAQAIADVNDARADTVQKKEKLEEELRSLSSLEDSLKDLSEEQAAQLEELGARNLKIANLLQSLSEEAQAKMEEEVGASLDEPEISYAAESQKEAEKEAEDSEKEDADSEEDTQAESKEDESEDSGEQKDDGKKDEGTESKEDAKPEETEKPDSEQSTQTAPQGSAAAVVAAAKVTPTTGYHQCSLWVRNVFLAAGQPDYGNRPAQNWMNEHSECFSSDKSKLKPGMIIVSGPLSFGTGNSHVGIYIGDGMVMHNTTKWVRGRDVGTWVATVTVDAWAAAYGEQAYPRWGWLGGIELT